MKFPSEYIQLADSLANLKTFKDYLELDSDKYYWPQRPFHRIYINTLQGVVRRKMKKAGWTILPNICEMRQPQFQVFLSPCGKFILKPATFAKVKKPKYLIPTYFTRSLKGKEDNTQWVLQPLADVTPRSRRLAEKFFAKNKLDRGDFHDLQIGFYKGKPVFLDF